MNYINGSKIKLGDKVKIDMPKGVEIARVVMLGENYAHAKLDEKFKDWVFKERILEKDSIILEWVNRNPLEHNDPKYAPVGNYVFAGISEDLELIERE